MIAVTTCQKPMYLTYQTRVLELGMLGEEPILEAKVLVEVDSDDPIHVVRASRLANACLYHIYLLDQKFKIESEVVHQGKEYPFSEDHYPQYSDESGRAWILSTVDRRG